MASVRDIVSLAFRKINVTALDTALTADELQNGVDTFNMMMHEWKLSGIDLAYSDLAANDAFPIGPEFQLGTVYMLALQLSPDYERPANFDADSFFRRIQAAYLTIGTVTLPSALTSVPSQSDYFGS